MTPMRPVCWILAMAALVSPAWGELKGAIEGATLRIEGVSLGGEVALLSVWREQLLSGPHASQTNIEDTLIDDDKDGVVEFEADRSIPTLSLWVAVDVATGDAAVVAPRGFSPRSMDAGRVAQFGEARVLVRRRELEVVVVRPGVATWRGRAQDAGVGDADRLPDQTVALSLQELDGPGEHGPALQSGDTVIAIDPVQMDVLTVRLK